jgi:hypothetical protein
MICLYIIIGRVLGLSVKLALMYSIVVGLQGYEVELVLWYLRQWL